FLPIPTGENLEEYVTYLLAVIEQAHQLREKALRRLNPEERQFLFAHAASLAEHFFPYFEGLDGHTRPQAEADWRFCQLVSERLDYAAIAAAADVEHGNSVVIDLAGNDTYHASPLGLATGRLGVGLLIDRTGDDVYNLTTGSGGAGFGGLGILIDGAGNDRYIGTRFTQ